MKTIVLVAALVMSGAASAMSKVGGYEPATSADVFYDHGYLIVVGVEAQKAMWDMDAPVKQLSATAGDFEKKSGDTTCIYTAATGATSCMIKIKQAK